jgi:peptidoglycan/xylan/chitin deacetylase (PgdA/CDA1 family)
VLQLAAGGIGGVAGLSSIASARSGDDRSATHAVTSTGSARRYDGIVVFRNDDPQPYWRSDALRDVTDLFVDEAVPVTYGVIPATEENGAHDPNGTFAEYLRELGREHGDLFEFAMHGYTHEFVSDWKGASEFGGLGYDRQYGRVQQGVNAFQQVLEESPSTFVAPGNTYDRTTARVLDEFGFDVASGNALVADEFGDSGVFQSEGLYHVMETTGMYDWGEDSFRSNRTLERKFDEKRRNGEVYVQMLHYQHFNRQDRLDQLRDLIRYTKSKNVYFTTLGGLARGLESGRIRRSGTDWIVGGEGGDGSDGSNGHDDGRDDDGNGHDGGTDDGGNGHDGGSDDLVDLTDVDGHAFESEIRTLVEEGVVDVGDDGRFGPERSVTRAQFAALIDRAFDLDPSRTEDFPDVDDHWAAEHIRRAAGAGFFSAYGNAPFGPERTIWKMEVVVDLSRGLGYSGGDPSVLSSAYDDVDEIPYWYRQHVANAHAAWDGIENYPDAAELDPMADATRADAAKYVYDASR